MQKSYQIPVQMFPGLNLNQTDQKSSGTLSDPEILPNSSPDVSGTKSYQIPIHISVQKVD